MKSIAITGHRPDAFLVSHYSPETVKMLAENMVVAYKREYDELNFYLGGAIGADQWVGEACIEHNVSYELVLPFSDEIQAKYWNDEQKAELQRQYQHAKGICIIDPSGNYSVGTYMQRNKKMVDLADFVVAFWVGKRRGGTFNAIQYALRQNKTVLNALNELRPIFKEDLKKGWTPPTMVNNNE